MITRHCADSDSQSYRSETSLLFPLTTILGTFAAMETVLWGTKTAFTLVSAQDDSACNVDV